MWRVVKHNGRKAVTGAGCLLTSMDECANMIERLYQDKLALLDRLRASTPQVPKCDKCGRDDCDLMIGDEANHRCGAWEQLSAPTAPQGDEEVIRFTVAPDPLTGEPMYTRVEPISPPVPSGPVRGEPPPNRDSWGVPITAPVPSGPREGALVDNSRILRAMAASCTCGVIGIGAQHSATCPSFHRQPPPPLAPKCGECGGQGEYSGFRKCPSCGGSGTATKKEIDHG
jgi:hypothetical protein